MNSRLSKQFVEETGETLFRAGTSIKIYNSDYVHWLENKLETLVQQSLSGSEPKGSTPKCSHMDIDRKTDDNNEPYYLCKKCGEILWALLINSNVVRN